MNAEAVTDTAKTPILIIIRGVPGSGKSHLATALQHAIGVDNLVILDPDAIDTTGEEYRKLAQALTSEGVDEKLHPYRFLRAAAYDAITAHKIIIWNQAFIDLTGFEKTVVRLQEYAAEHGTQLPVLVVEVEIHGDTAKQRVAKRAAEGGHDVPEHIFDRFIEQYASFSEKGYKTVTVNGEDDVTASADSVLAALTTLRS